jgi:hypothetical protein
VEKLERPTIIQETIRPSERIEVQPLVHIDKDQVEVHKVVQPMRERDIAPTRVEHVSMAPQHMEYAAPQTQFRSTQPIIQPRTMVEPLQRSTLERPPIVEETIHKKVVEEVQPVLYRETVAPTVVHATKPIHQHIVEPTQYVEETRGFVDLGTRNLQTFPEQVVPRAFESGLLNQQPMAQMPISQQGLPLGGPTNPLHQGLQFQQPLGTGTNLPTSGLQQAAPMAKEIIEEKITVTSTQVNPPSGPKTVI